MISVSQDGIQVRLREYTTDQHVFEDNLIRRPMLKHLVIGEGNWLDCGGYIGTFALFLLKGGAAGVFSVEALPDNVVCYRENLALNSYKPVLYEGAVLNEPAQNTVELHMTSRAQGQGYKAFSASTIYSRWKREHLVITVPTIAFDVMVARAVKKLGVRRPWNLKLDIEGAELDILERADLSLFQQIYFEYHFHGDASYRRANNILKRLEGLGFTMHVSRKLPKTGKAVHYRELIFLGWASRGSVR